MKNILASIMAVSCLSSVICLAEDAPVISNDIATTATEAIETVAESTPKYTVESLLEFVPAIVATSNDEPLVTRDEIIEKLTPQIEFALSQGDSIEITPDIIRNYVMKFAADLANSKIIRKAAEAAGISVTEEEIKATIDQQIALLKQQVGGEENFVEMLKQFGKTEDIVRQEAASQMGDALLIDKFLTSKAAAPTEEEIAQVYEENKTMFTTLRASHILKRFNTDNQTPTAEQKEAALEAIKAIKARLDNGEDFAAVATAESDCPSKEQGGDLGEFQMGQMVPEFEQALLTLAEGQISEPVETIFGYHLIKAGACVTKDLSDPEIAEAIKQFLTMQKQENVATEIIQAANLKFEL